MSSDEDFENFEGLPWDAWLAATRAQPSTHRVHISQIGFDAASMPCQKAVCYGYYPSIELNSMLLVKCKHCGMLLKDVGYGHHMRSRHGFRAESPASADECQSFLLSPPHHIASPKLTDPAILSPPYRKPSTPFHMQVFSFCKLASSPEERAASITSRTISPRYSIEQRDDLKLSLRVSRREVSIENGPKASVADVDVKEKPVIATAPNKQVNGRVKQKKKKKRKRDSSEEDHMSLEHLRRKKRLETQKSSCTDTAPCSSSALHLETTSGVGEKPVAVAAERRSWLRSPPLFSVSSAPSFTRIPAPSSVNDGSQAAPESAVNSFMVSRLPPLVVADTSATTTSCTAGALVLSNQQGSPRLAVSNLLTATLRSSSSREPPAPLSPFEGISADSAQETAFLQRCRSSAMAGTRRSTTGSEPRRVPLECTPLSSPNQNPVMVTCRGNTSSPLRSPLPHLSPVEQKSFLISPTMGSLAMGATTYGCSVAVAATGSVGYSTEGGILEGRREEELGEYNEMRATVNGLKEIRKERQVNFRLSSEILESAGQTQTHEVGNEFATSARLATTACSMSDDESTAFKDENENDQGVVVLKQELAKSPSSSASVIALSPEGQHSEMEVGEGDVSLREQESEEEIDVSQAIPSTLTHEQPFVTPSVQHRCTQISLVNFCFMCSLVLLMRNTGRLRTIAH
ncbi:unnamed protein product [Toxocara canis]|uniref:C2H2-type domain-containing protein n=1 Tax=Toxocara canis TaxID=6265 RepID=A0A183UTV9_TOXCA|nr:unnamed protein product [Toxocara canis]